MAPLHLEKELRLDLKKCDQCMKMVKHTYFCDFCGMNFCSECTIKEAHEENFDKFTDVIECRQIHKPIKDLTKIDEVVSSREKIVEGENHPNNETCQCGKSTKNDYFECKDCGNNFCPDCPTAPIGDNCLQCLMNNNSELYPVTSTPKK